MSDVFSETCFVMQPFDQGKQFDKRFDETIAPAITKANLKPYRVDRDDSVSVPIETIKHEIQKSKICIADISEDNPNVWFELGYAIALNKEVVFVCEKQSRDKYPFDVQHYQIISYEKEVRSDFDKLEKEITSRILERIKKAEKLESIAESPIQATEGLTPHEIATLIVIDINSFVFKGCAPAKRVLKDVCEIGFTEAAVSIAAKMLIKKGLILCEAATYNDNDCDVYKTTKKGDDWIVNNQDKFVLQKPEPESLPF